MQDPFSILKPMNSEQKAQTALQHSTGTTQVHFLMNLSPDKHIPEIRGKKKMWGNRFIWNWIWEKLNESVDSVYSPGITPSAATLVLERFMA